MTPEQKRSVLSSIEELEAFAGCLLDKCTNAKKLILEAGAVSTAAKGRRMRQPVLSKQQLAEISAKRRARLYKQ